MNNIFGRVNTKLPEEQWRSMMEDILEDGLLNVIQNYSDFSPDYNPKNDDDPKLGRLMLKAHKALEELQDYLEVGKFDEDHPEYQADVQKGIDEMEYWDKYS